MLVSSLSGAVPLSGPVPSVSIILPTYNRARFLPQAFESIRSQQWTDWELIVVDDGSTDETRQLVAELSREIPQKVLYVYQENQGAYGARNTGLDRVRGNYIAFFDSDDVWLPHHLQNCVVGLNANPDVDWIYGACRIVDEGTGQTLAPSTFRIGNQPRPFQRLRHRKSGAVQILDDHGAFQCAVLHGFYCGLQNSVIRSTVFAARRFEAARRNEAEDQLIVLLALLDGRNFAYLDDVHVIYKVHADNSSVAGNAGSLEKRIRVLQALAEGFEQLRHREQLPVALDRAVRQRLNREYFWHLGYAVLWQGGRRREAIRMFRRGIRYWPWDLRCWKTLAIATVRSYFGLRERPC